jgi:hypothetical protein
MCNSVESRSFRFAVSSLEREHDSSFIVLTLVIVEGGGLRVKCTSYRAKLWSSRLIVVEGGGGLQQSLWHATALWSLSSSVGFIP